jgi:hypothetical protein
VRCGAVQPEAQGAIISRLTRCTKLRYRYGYKWASSNSSNSCRARKRKRCRYQFCNWRPGNGAARERLSGGSTERRMQSVRVSGSQQRFHPQHQQREGVTLWRGTGMNDDIKAVIPAQSYDWHAHLGAAVRCSQGALEASTPSMLQLACSSDMLWRLCGPPGGSLMPSPRRAHCKLVASTMPPAVPFQERNPCSN